MSNILHFLSSVEQIAKINSIIKTSKNLQNTDLIIKESTKEFIQT